MLQQLKSMLAEVAFIPFVVKVNDGSAYPVPSREHAWMGSGRSGLLFVEDDHGSVQIIALGNVASLEILSAS
jgi:hypothetical protein